MKHYKEIGAILSVLLISLTGCGESEYHLNDEQMTEVGEYAAVTLLKYDANNRSRLVSPEIVAEADRRQAAWDVAAKVAPTPTPTPQTMEEVEDTPVIEKEKTWGNCESISNCMELPEGIELQYRDYFICKNYDSGNEALVYAAEEGKSFLIVQLEISNHNDSDRPLSLYESGTHFAVKYEDKRIAASPTFLDNDILTMPDFNLVAGSTEDVILFFEIEDSLEQIVPSMELQCQRGENRYATKL